MDHKDYECWSRLWTFSTFVKQNMSNQTIDYHKYNDQFQHVVGILHQQPIPTIIILHTYQALDPLLRTAITLVKNQTIYPIKFANKMMQMVSFIYTMSYECLLIHLAQYNYIQLYEQLEGKLVSIEQEQRGGRGVLVTLLLRWFQICRIASNHEKRKQMNRFINEELLVEQAESYCEQVFFNWIKRGIEIVQLEDQSRVCCRIHFQHNMPSNVGKFSESSNHEFKDYHWPLEIESIKFHLTKTIVGFMNTKTGGIIFVGLKEDKHKIITVKGIKLTRQQKKDFLFFLHDEILSGVYPKDNIEGLSSQEYRNNLKQQFDLNKRKKIKQYRMNRYVHVDFMDVFDEETLLNQKQESTYLYIVRIKIKIGSSKELYHVLNKDKEIPEGFVRSDKSVKKMGLKQFFDEYYLRMLDNNETAAEVINNHPNCRFNAKCTEI